jgi:hypothetical protein
LSDLVISSSQQQELPQPILILDLKLLSPVGFKAEEEEEEEEESLKLGKKSLLEQFVLSTTTAKPTDDSSASIQLVPSFI